MTRRLRDVATLLVLTMWTLYNCVAPGHDHDGHCDDNRDYDWTSPDVPHGEKLAGLVLLILNVQRHASAHVVVVPWKGSLSQILVLAMLFVFSVLALNVVVAEELLLQADILTGPFPEHLKPACRSLVSLHGISIFSGSNNRDDELPM